MTDGKLATGIIGTSFGLNGFVKVRPYSEDTAHFRQLKTVTVEKNGVTKELTVSEVQISAKNVLMRFAGYDNPEIAKTLSGYVIWIERSQAGALGKGEYYLADVPGLSVKADGSVLGKVVSCVEGPQGTLLEIVTEEETHLVPFTPRFFCNLDLRERTIEIKDKLLLS